MFRKVHSFELNKIKTFNVCSFHNLGGQWMQYVLFFSTYDESGIHYNWLGTFSRSVCVCELWLWKAQWFLLTYNISVPETIHLFFFSSFCQLKENTPEQEVNVSDFTNKDAAEECLEYNSLLFCRNVLVICCKICHIWTRKAYFSSRSNMHAFIQLFCLDWKCNKNKSKNVHLHWA